MKKQSKEQYLYVDNYGEMLAQINQMELVKYDEDGGYSGDYLVVLTDGTRLYYYIGSYGSCPGCDFLEAEAREYFANNKRYAIEIEDALEYCNDTKPTYIVPKDSPLVAVNMGEYSGFEFGDKGK